MKPPEVVVGALLGMSYLLPLLMGVGMLRYALGARILPPQWPCMRRAGPIRDMHVNPVPPTWPADPYRTAPGAMYTER